MNIGRDGNSEEDTGRIPAMLRLVLLTVIVLAVHAAQAIAAATTSPSSTQPAATQPASRQANRRVQVIISGRVQGVGFRAFTQAEARKLELRGWVLNRSDGTVEAVIEGPTEQVDRLLAMLKRGPEGARVDKISVSEQAYTGKLGRFEVRYELPGDGAP